MEKKISEYSKGNSIFKKIVNLDYDERAEENFFHTIPEEILEEAVFMGTGILKDKKKIHTFFLTVTNQSERIQILKEIYYYVMLCPNGVFVKQLQANPMKGLLISWKNRELEKKEWVSWEKVEQIVTELIRKERYLMESYCLQERQYQIIDANKEEILSEVKNYSQGTKNQEKANGQPKWEQNNKEEKIKIQDQTAIAEHIHLSESIKLTEWKEDSEKEKFKYELVYYIEEKEWYSMMLREMQRGIEAKSNWNKWKNRLCLQYHLFSERWYNSEEYKEDKIYRLDNYYLEKEDLQKFASTLMLSDMQARKDHLTAYWKLYDRREENGCKKEEEKERSTKIRDLERALNGTDDRITFALHKRYELWLKKNPKLEQKYKRKRKKEREKVRVENRNQLADLFYYIEEIELKKIDCCIMVMPAVVIYYVEKEILPFYANILYKRYGICNEKENINIIFMTPEQFEWSGLKRKRRIEYLQSKLELVQRYIYMEQHIQERNEEREKYFLHIEQELLEKIKNNNLKDIEKFDLSRKKIYVYQQEEQEKVILGKHVYKK